MGKISGSHQCHEVLSAQPVGWEFTHVTFKQVVHQHYPDLTDGVVTGFITRAKRMGMIEVIGSVKVLAKRKPIFKYRYVQKVDWKFKPPGIGSYPGREIMGRKHDRIDTPESIGNLIMQADSVLPKTPAGDMWPTPLRNQDQPDHLHTLEAEIEYDKGSLSDQLINLAIKVNDLENRPVKTLADYSTNDLIEELKKRVK